MQNNLEGGKTMKEYIKPELEKIEFSTEKVMADVGVGYGEDQEVEGD